ncbi:hypothetical protein C8J57DRAFT_1234220 [Mycena rebaudengoi]|nr:hypothetical protein C8J57DRAFT_1234220 [Mycena rebaudengoi]
MTEPSGSGMHLQHASCSRMPWIGIVVAVPDTATSVREKNSLVNCIAGIHPRRNALTQYAVGIVTGVLTTFLSVLPSFGHDHVIWGLIGLSSVGRSVAVYATQLSPECTATSLPTELSPR